MIIPPYQRFFICLRRFLNHANIANVFQISPLLCLYSEFFWSVFSRIPTEYGEILRISQYASHFISLTLFSVGLTNSYSKITNKYQLKQKYKISIDLKINI